YALISDLHSNLEALTAVFADMAGFKVDQVYCLGDVVGYGPNPRECLDLVKEKCAWTLLGNHEEGLLQESFGADFNERARRALDWTRETLSSPTFPKEKNYAFWSQIDAFEATRRTDDAMFVHGSPRDPVREYVMPQDAANASMMADVFAKIDRPVCFAGHTHVPGVFTPDGGFRHQSELPETVKLPPKSFINVGSAGQPRDGDNRACYLLVDGDAVRFRRVPYDLVTTMRKIKATPQLDDFLAARLKVGK
ncbi:MAG TPA: metallophosphoesterase, partial [Planctomycetota bacterium]|nr:metallophosphoesterase [Planctomycetota bacterium]